MFPFTLTATESTWKFETQLILSHRWSHAKRIQWSLMIKESQETWCLFLFRQVSVQYRYLISDKNTVHCLPHIFMYLFSKSEVRNSCYTCAMHILNVPPFLFDFWSTSLKHCAHILLTVKINSFSIMAGMLLLRHILGSTVWNKTVWTENKHRQSPPPPDSYQFPLWIVFSIAFFFKFWPRVRVLIPIKTWFRSIQM
jgi:hypothetical protein